MSPNQILRLADVEVVSEKLTDGSTAWGVRIGGRVFDCYSEKNAHDLAQTVAASLKLNCPGSCHTVIPKLKPQHGDTGVCASCGQPIQYVDQGTAGYWSHQRGEPRHLAEPKDL